MKPESRLRFTDRLSVGKIGTGTGVCLLSLCLLSACASAPQQLAEIGCSDACYTRKERCIADARDDYRQCQAGYNSSFRTYRWCLAASSEQSQCGYPWWSCAENLYGYCTNRYSECERACQEPRPPASSVPASSAQPKAKASA